MKREAELRFHEALRFTLDFSHDHCFHHITNVENLKIQFYIYTSYINCFSVCFIRFDANNAK